jgi:hypothetical protein
LREQWRQEQLKDQYPDVPDQALSRAQPPAEPQADERSLSRAEERDAD